MQIFLVKETSVEVEVGGDGRGGKGRVSTTVNLSTAVQENFPLVITWTLLPSPDQCRAYLESQYPIQN